MKLEREVSSWLGYQDLNLGMAGSKPAALPLGDIPTKNNLIVLVLIKNMVRKERLELSQPKLLEPKSSASTNSATPASFALKVLVVILNSSLSNKKNGG